jgi:hypothetical protein
MIYGEMLEVLPDGPEWSSTPHRRKQRACSWHIGDISTSAHRPKREARNLQSRLPGADPQVVRNTGPSRPIIDTAWAMSQERVQLNRKLAGLVLVSALVGALTLAATGRSGTNPASCVDLARVVQVRDALTSDGCTEDPNADFLGGVHQHLRVWYRNRPNIKIEDLEGIETVDPGCSQESPTVVVCPNRESISIRTYGGRDFIRTGGGPGTTVAADSGRGIDTILGGRGSQRMFGGSRDDTLKGRRGHDELHGEEGDDLLNGGRGNDRCVSGQGNDRLRHCEYGTVPGDPPRVRVPEAAGLREQH